MISRADVERAFTDHSSDVVRSGNRQQLSLWWLRSKTDVRPVLLYGWLVPHFGRFFPSWTKRALEEKNFGSGSTSVERWSICLEMNEAQQLLGELASGKTLGEASASCGRPPPTIGSDWVFASETREMLSPIYLTSGASQALLPVFAKSRTSPTVGAGCYCYRFANTDKLGFLTDHPAPDELLRWLVPILDRETGLGFRYGAADAFGSVEVLRFPLLTGRSSQLEVVAHNNRRGANEITISLREHEDCKLFRIHVRATVLNDVVFDQMRDFTDKASLAMVEIPDPIDGISVRVWRASSTSGPWVLCHEEDRQFIREISTDMNLMGLSGRLNADWLERVGRSKHHARAEALMRIQQVGYHDRMLTSSRQPWEVATRQARQAVQRVFPQASGAAFFKKGWEGDEKLAFAEWIRKELSNHRGRIIVLDPYFDIPGLELLSRASGAADDIVVLTCCQLQSEDDKLEPNVARPVRLQRECEHLAPILSGIRLRVIDLRSKGGGGKQLFHDRYVLFYDSNTEVSRGYQLSTSLQSATRTTPLLVTPIPADVLDDVADYVSGLIAPDSPTIDQLVLWPPESSVATQWPNESEANSILRFVEALSSLTNSDAPNAAARLAELGLLSDARINVKWTTDDLKNLASWFSNADFKEQVSVWCGMAETRAHGHGLNGFIEAFATFNFTLLESFLPRYLHAIIVGEADAGSQRPARQVVRTLAHVFGDPYSEALEDAESFYDHVHAHPIGTTWPIHFAVATLVQFFPAGADTLAKQAKGARAEEVLSALAVAATIYARENDSQGGAAFLTAQTPFLRALGSISLWRQVQRGERPLDAFIEELRKLSTEDRAWTLARAVHEARILANQGREDERGQELRRSLIKHFVDTFVELANPNAISQFIPSLSGPLNGSWAQSTNDDVLVPLIQRGVVQDSDLLTLWGAVLDEKLDQKESQFFPPTDVELLDVWAQAFWRGTELQRSHIATLSESEIAKAQRTLDEPFLSSRDYSRWRLAADRIIWWLLRWAAVTARQPDKSSAETARKPTELARSAVLENGLVDSAIGEFKVAAASAIASLAPVSDAS